jgi:hypothetical protein
MRRNQRKDDRRASVRFEVVGGLHGTLVSDWYVQVRSVSATGVLIESSTPLTIDSRVSLKVAIGNSIPVQVRHITNASPTEYLIGLEFATKNPALLQHLTDLSISEG